MNNHTAVVYPSVQNEVSYQQPITNRSEFSFKVKIRSDRKHTWAQHAASKTYFYQVLRRIEYLAAKDKNGFVYEQTSQMAKKTRRFKQDGAPHPRVVQRIKHFLREKGFISGNTTGYSDSGNLVEGFYLLKLETCTHTANGFNIVIPVHDTTKRKECFSFIPTIDSIDGWFESLTSRQEVVTESYQSRTKVVAKSPESELKVGLEVVPGSTEIIENTHDTEKVLFAGMESGISESFKSLESLESIESSESFESASLHTARQNNSTQSFQDLSLKPLTKTKGAGREQQPPESSPLSVEAPRASSTASVEVIAEPVQVVLPPAPVVAAKPILTDMVITDLDSATILAKRLKKEALKISKSRAIISGTQLTKLATQLLENRPDPKLCLKALTHKVESMLDDTFRLNRCGIELCDDLLDIVQTYTDEKLEYEELVRRGEESAALGRAQWEIENAEWNRQQTEEAEQSAALMALFNSPREEMQNAVS